MHEPNQPAPEDTPPKEEFPSAAWQPLTPRGIAAFAYAGYWRLLLAQLVVGALAAGTIVWFLSNAWFPVIRQAIKNLPDKGSIVWGQLSWTNQNFAVLGEQRPFLLLIVDLDQLSGGSSGVDLSFRFHKHDVEVCSLLGYAVFPYPKEYEIEFNRVELQPRWDAWRPSIAGWTAVVTPLLLLIIWAILALVYSPVARLIAFFSDRKLGMGGSWRLCSAALIPGALLLSAALFLYGLAILDLLHLLLAIGLHLVVGWVYVVIATLQLPKGEMKMALKGNPFSDAPASEPEKPKTNPFSKKS